MSLSYGDSGAVILVISLRKDIIVNLTSNLNVSKFLSLLVPSLKARGHSTLILTVIVLLLTGDHHLDQERSKDRSQKKAEKREPS